MEKVSLITAGREVFYNSPPQPRPSCCTACQGQSLGPGKAPAAAGEHSILDRTAQLLQRLGASSCKGPHCSSSSTVGVRKGTGIRAGLPG